MSQSNQNQIKNDYSQNACWKYLYITGGIAALLSVLVGQIEIIVNFFPEGSYFSKTIEGWFDFLQNSSFFALRNLGLLNLIFIPMGIPIFLALFAVHRRVNPGFSILAMAVSYIGITIFLSTNRALPMFELSNQYAEAVTDAQKTALIAAGQAMLSVGRGHSPGSFVGFLFGNISGIIISLVMLKAGIFKKITAWFGIIGFSLLLIFEIGHVFVPALPDAAIAVTLCGGLSCVAWQILVAIKLFRLGRIEK